MKKTLPIKLIQGTPIEQFRARTFWDKEPETIAWIEGMARGDVFIDVGANIGVYSLYAAFLGLNVVAFEPDMQNCSRLSENAKLNGLVVQSYVGALADKNGWTTLYQISEEVGASGHQIDEPVSEDGDKFFPVEQNHVYCTRFDDYRPLTDKLTGPYHVKIDVDGQELRVLDGMERALVDPNLKSLLIEVNGEDRRNTAFMVMTAAGFEVDRTLNEWPNHSRHRRKREGIGAENLIFRRVDA